MSDPLIDKIDQLSNSIKASAHNAKKRFDQSAYGRFQHDANIFQKFARTFLRSCIWIYLNIVHPVGNWLFWKPAKWIFWKYVALWNLVTYKNDQYGTRIFSKIRGVTMVIATGGFLYATPAMADFVWDAAILYPLTSKVHTVYMNGQQKVPGLDEEIHEAGGCDDHPGCSGTETSAYRIRSTPFNQFWSIVRHFEWYDPVNLFYPDYIARAIPQQTSKCLIHSYGWRQKFVGRSLYRSFDMYADILEVIKCDPVEATQK